MSPFNIHQISTSVLYVLIENDAIKSNAMFCSECHDSWIIAHHQNVIIGLENILSDITFSHIVVLYMEKE